MRHPGILISILFVATLLGSIVLVRYLKDNAGQSGGYVCPPCGCQLHDKILDAPGICRSCGMPLITAARTPHHGWRALFMNTDVPFYHHKFLYPVNFLALFIGFFAWYRFRRELPMALFFLLFLSLVLYSFKNQLYGTSYSMHASRRWAFFPISFLLAAPPALYLYFSKRLSPAGLSGSDRTHFLPALIVFAINAFIFVDFRDWGSAAIYNNYDHFPGLAEQLTFIASGIFYSRLIGKSVRGFDDPVDPAFQHWQSALRGFLWAIIATMALMIGGNLVFFDLMSTGLDYHAVWFCIAAFTLWSTYFLVFKKEIIFQKKGTLKESRLADDQLAAWKARLESVMKTQKPYLNPDLSLQSLAQIIGIRDKDLSEVLNTGFSKSFHDYINLFRIEEVKSLLLNPEKQHLTNFAMAQESGFNSKSAFFGLFKKYVGMTPGEYKRNRLGILPDDEAAAEA